MTERYYGGRMKIRRKVLDMTYDEWKKLDKEYNLKENLDDATFETTPEEFLEKIGLPCGLSVYYNEAETEFFEQIYSLERRKRDDI